MKKPGLLLALFLFYKVHAQDYTKKMVDKTWYVSGDILKGQKSHLNHEKPTTPHNEMQLSDNKLLLKTEGNFVFACNYVIKDELFIVNYIINSSNHPKKQNSIRLIYKISEVSNGKGFQLNPVSEAENK